MRDDGGRARERVRGWVQAGHAVQAVILFQYFFRIVRRETVPSRAARPPPRGGRPLRILCTSHYRRVRVVHNKIGYTLTLNITQSDDEARAARTRTNRIIPS